MYLGWLLVIFCQCLVVFSHENDTLVAVQMLYRHGDRTPMAVYPNDPNKKLVYRETSSAQLTNKGKERQYKLGQWLRKRYNGFLPSKYSNSDIKILTDDEDRCFMSAMSNLAGLYPPKGQQIWNKDIKWQPIPVRFNLSLQTPENCPVYEDLSNKAELELFEDICSQHGDILEYLAEKTGAEINDMATLVYTIIDPLKCEEAQGLKLPKWTDTVYPKPLVDWVSLYYSLGTSSSKLAQFRIGPVFQSILDHFENVNEKVIMYSSHDSSLVDIVYTLQPNHPKFWPEFASVVILELWQNKDEEYVKLTLKRDNTIEEINIDQCGVKCNLEKFKKLVEPVALTLEKRQQLCKN
ncbi:unnamed protein product [Brassicogethes aeneus]|uniref:acid phosphatase n=1 Tax=Brassicogethes aeneus TaxID=1431903 RepID=A0A9P0ARF4_BRAAE|nr:unnamed protein product [Brassicogethes aeneus]